MIRTVTRILAAMSGGVDSSVAALLLKRGGYDVSGVTMCIGTGGEAGARRCCSPGDIVDARRVCAALGIEHHVISMSDDMEREVIAPFVEEYLCGRTPNPCVLCNERIKFRLLADKLAGARFDMIATGHYARLERRDGVLYLSRPKDLGKDQTYFLYSIPRERLERVLFPVGELAKDEVRALADEAGLSVSEKRESQDVCFWPEGGAAAFFAARGIPSRPGQIVSVDGEIVGEHDGIFNYTIGQRRRLGISAPEPLYVIAIDPARDRLIVGPEAYLGGSDLLATAVNFPPGEKGGRAEAKIRYAHAPAPCEFSLKGSRLEVRFDEPQRAITPGQSVVVYRDGLVLGGGVIEAKR
ncbi:MAG: tRNA 2-thiouridine(34) synthase MnmA [Candidatus Krumholzibacteria bacterium]|nr:tRNA 2-thiouridine(34) synthase MnmA [Candidatus Krumholzibacteria bacterium]